MSCGIFLVFVTCGYIAWVDSIASDRNPGKQDVELFGAIVNVKKVTNDIAPKVKPMKHPSAKALNQVLPLIDIKITEQPEIPAKIQKKVTDTFSTQALLTNESNNYAELAVV